MDRSRYLKTIGAVLAALVALAPLFFAGAAEEPPFTGVVNVNDANLRAGANPNYEVVTQVRKGDVLYVAGKWMQWLKVRCPEGTLLWASAEFIQNGRVLANKLNVRSGPDLKFNVICQLAQDDLVTVAKTSADGKWAGIVPPENAYLCIHEDLVDKIGGPEIFEKQAKRTAELRGRLEKVELKRDITLQRKPQDIPFDDMIEEYEAIAKEYSDFKEQSALASKRAADLRKMKEMLGDQIATADTGTGEKTPEEKIVVEPDNTDDEANFVPRYLTSKGRLVPAEGKAGEQGMMKIVKGGDVLCVVRSDVVLLKLYKNKNVQIWGSEEYSAAWNVPLIRVTRIEELK